jgi:hypothetical protein
MKKSKLKLKFPLGKGNYYFRIQSGLQKILIHRKKKEEAIRKVLQYQTLGKNCEWLGRWDGKEFTESNLSELSAA